MRRYFVSLLSAALLLAAGGALGQAVDVALVSMVSGEVAYLPQAGTRAKVRPFIKLRDGDRVDVASGARLRIVYFEGAREELWAGPASFRVRRTAAEAISGKPAQARNLPAGVAQGLARIPERLRYPALGGSKVRGALPHPQKAGANQQASLAQARAAYENMRKEASADDITPELYLYAVLYEFLAYGEMRAVVAEMQRKQPDNPDLKTLDVWLSSRMGSGAAQPDEPRVALVIGNSAYKDAPLKNPVNDATDMAAALGELGFKVSLRTDANRRQMKQALRQFARDLKRGGVGLFYFAGHGVQSKGRNFLIPIGANVETEAELEDESVDANLVLAYMDEAQNRVNIVVLDACRNNPFARSFRSVAGGLAQMDAARGSFIAFATAPGSVAADGDGRNGVYTEQLLASLRQPDGDIDKVFRRVAASVATVTNGRQVPWVASSLTGDFYFRMAPDEDAVKLKRAEQERADLAQALEQERTRREQEAAAAKQRAEQERAQLAKQLEEAREQREKDAELVRAEIGKLRAELQRIRAQAAAQPMTQATAATAAPTTKPAPAAQPEEPAQVALAAPTPDPAHGAPAAVDGWKQHIAVLEKLSGQLSYSKAMAILLGVNDEGELGSLVNYQSMLERMPYQSALALGVNNMGFLVWRRYWGKGNEYFATQSLLERCNAQAIAGSCRTVMINGKFQEKAFMQVAALLGRQKPERVRIQFFVIGLPRDLDRGTRQ